jgi:hypothetical protein
MTDHLTPRERMFRALRGQTPDVLPAAFGYPSLFLEDFERAFYIEQYRLRMRGGQRYAIDHEEDTLFRARALFQSYGVFKVRPDWIEVGRGATRAWAERTEIVDDEGMLHYEDRASGVRLPMHAVPMPWGDRGLVSQAGGATDQWESTHKVDSTEQVDALVPLRSSGELLARGDWDLPRQVVADYGGHYFISTVLDPPFSSLYGPLSFQDLMVMPYDRPKLFHYTLARRLTQLREVIDAWASVGVHGAYVQETFTGADLISPRSYEELVFDYNAPYFQHLARSGILSIHYVCGDAVPRLERIVQYDLDAVAVEESKKNFVIELEDVVDIVDGRAAVFGNIDAVQFGIHATMGEMAAEVKRQARIGARAKGFVVSTGSPFPLDTNPRLIDTLAETAHSLPGG